MLYKDRLLRELNLMSQNEVDIVAFFFLANLTKYTLKDNAIYLRKESLLRVENEAFTNLLDGLFFKIEDDRYIVLDIHCFREREVRKLLTQKANIHSFTDFEFATEKMLEEISKLMLDYTIFRDSGSLRQFQICELVPYLT